MGVADIWWGRLSQMGIGLTLGIICFTLVFVRPALVQDGLSSRYHMNRTTAT